MEKKVEHMIKNGKKVLFVIDLIKGGGGAQKVLKIAMQTLKKNGFETELIVLKRSNEELDFSEFRVHYVLNEDDKLLPNSFIILEKLRNLMREFDIVCTFIDFITTYYVALAIELNCFCVSKNANAKQALESRELASHKTDQKLICFVRSKLSFLSQSFALKELNLDLAKLSLSRADKVVANSIECQKELLEFGIKNPLLLNNPIILPKHIENNLNLNKNYALAVGRLSKEKDYETMIKAFKKANCKDLKLIILGEGDLKNSLLELAKGANIEFLGYKKNVITYLANAKFFIQTSLFEGSSNSVLESYALGVPAILSDIPQNREIYNLDACYVPCKDITSLSNSIRKLNENSTKFNPNLTKFSIENFEKTLLGIFK
ncbi:glycosyltransferase [Campylobacter fetus]